jgi:hypothetical protein
VVASPLAFLVADRIRVSVTAGQNPDRPTVIPSVIRKHHFQDDASSGERMTHGYFVLKSSSARHLLPTFLLPTRRLGRDDAMTLI